MKLTLTTVLCAVCAKESVRRVLSRLTGQQEHGLLKEWAVCSAKTVLKAVLRNAYILSPATQSQAAQ